MPSLCEHAWVQAAAIWAIRLICASGLLASPAVAIEARLSLNQLHHKSWTLRDGAPQGAWAIAQTTDGRLWLATSSGLYHFDGVRFERFRLPDHVSPRLNAVVALEALPSGGLLVGLRGAGGAYLLEGGKLTEYGATEGFPSGTVYDFALGQGGVWWVATNTGVARYVGGRWQKVGAEMHLPAGSISGVLVDRLDNVWLTGLAGAFLMESGSSTFRKLDIKLFQGKSAEAPDGTVWYSGEPGMVSLSHVAAGRPADQAPGFRPPDYTGPMAIDRHGGMWFTFIEGLGRVAEPSKLGPPDGSKLPAELQRFSPKQGLSGDGVRFVFEDREGNIWVSTNGGLDQFRAPKLTRLDQEQLWEARMAPAADGEVVVGSMFRGVSHVGRNGALRHVPKVGRYTQALYRAPDGTLWVGGLRLWHSVGDDFAELTLPTTPPHGEPDMPVAALDMDRDGGLWASITRGGLFRWFGGRWLRNGGHDLLPKLAPSVMRVDAQGRLWLGYTDGQLAMREADGSRIHLMKDADGLRLGYVQSIMPIAEEIWFGGAAGLSRYSGGRFQPLRLQGDDSLHGTSAILQSDDGALWLNHATGITRLAPEQLDRFRRDPGHRVAFERLDSQDGLLGSASPTSSGAKGTDGRLWFATTRGVFSIDPARVTGNDLVPTVEVRGLQVDGQRHAPRDGLRLPAGTRRLDIDYTALSLSIPERVRFRYRLEGAGSDWQDAGPRRQAFFTNLRPGPYRFHVMASNDDGVWNERGAAVSFEIEPRFFETHWFMALCVIAASCLLWLLHHLRLRQQEAAVRGRLEVRMQERERIARDLHDTLLQSTQGLILTVQGIAQSPQASPVRDRLERVLVHADAALAEGRDRVHELRTAVRLEQELPLDLERVAEEFGGEHAAPVVVAVHGPVKPLRHEAYQTVRMVGREAILNALRHADASLVQVDLHFEPGEVRLQVRDDGTGVNPQLLDGGSRAGHWGLPGMRERARLSGGELQVRTRDPSGTEVALRLPASSAYPGPRRHRWRWPLSRSPRSS